MTTTASKIKDWIQKTGFPLEMEVAAALQHEGFNVVQSHIFQDSQQEKSREIDVFATDPDFLGIVDITFVIECKASSKPWVVLKQAAGPIQYNKLLSFGVTSEPARSELVKRVFNKSVPDYVDFGVTAGYGLRQAFSDDGESSGSICIPLLKAAHQITQSPGVKKLPRHAFCFPVLVVSSPLFECSLKADGELEISEVNASSFLLESHIPDRVGCTIQIVSRLNLEKFALEARAIASKIRADFQAVQDRYIPPSA